MSNARPVSIALTALVFTAVILSACAPQPHPSSPSAVAVADRDDASPDGAGDDAGDASTTDDASATAENADAGDGSDGPCPSDMVLVTTETPAPRRFCIDRYEASLVEVLEDGSEAPYPHYVPVDGHEVRAVSKAHTFPQGYISEVQAQDACGASGKRLCNLDEWKTACMGPAHTTFPYGDARRPGTCHDTGKSAVIAVFGAKAVMASTPAAPAPVASHAAPAASGKRAHKTRGRAAQSSRARATASKSTTKQSPRPPTKKNAPRKRGKKSARPANVDPGVWARLNDPALGQVEGALAKTGDHPECVNDFGAYDMVGNLHEWVATDPAAVHGTFAGGYYLDTTINGDGCNYRTVAHAHDYHDYSTGFRCCTTADAPDGD
jgi:formylglycine-generating enzyme required for sulfatase activity